MKQLKFDHKYVQALKDGSKTVTFRVNDDKDIRPGDVVEVIDKVDLDFPSTWEVPGFLEIQSVKNVAFSDLNKEDISSLHSFGNDDEMLQTFQRFYGDHVNEETQILVVMFTYKPYETVKKFISKNDEKISLKAVEIYADGGSRGNPGPSASGYVIKTKEGDVVHSENKYLGITTNNQAEYHALIIALEWCLKHNVLDVSIFLDSMLVVNQIKGVFKVKNRDLFALNETAKTLIRKFRKHTITHIPRELNRLADAEVNKALDAVRGSDVVQ